MKTKQRDRLKKIPIWIGLMIYERRATWFGNMNRLSGNRIEIVFDIWYHCKDVKTIKIMIEVEMSNNGIFMVLLFYLFCETIYTYQVQASRRPVSTIQPSVHIDTGYRPPDARITSLHVPVSIIPKCSYFLYIPRCTCY